MLDLFEIMVEYKQLNINEFFQVQAKSEFTKGGKPTCKIEIPLVSDQFSIFSNQASQCFKLDQQKCGISHPISDYLEKYIIDMTSKENELGD